MPCFDSSENNSQSGHVVNNHCVAAVGTDFWVDEITQAIHSKKSKLHTNLMLADIVVVETAVNDVADLRTDAHLHHSDPEMQIVTFTELLVNVLLSMQNRPSIIFLGASSRVVGHGLRLQGDSVHAHLRVTKYYDIPHVSAIDGIGPFESEDMQRWFYKVFRVDNCCHITVTGHKIVSQMMLKFLLWHSWSAKVPMIHGIDQIYQVPKPKYVQQSEIDMYVLSNPLHVSTTKSADIPHRLGNSAGWNAMEDVPGKPGLIANKTGEFMMYFFLKSEVEEHAKVGTIHISLLMSYANMGTIEVTLFRTNEENGVCVGDPSSPGYLSLGSKTIDCLWEKIVSETQIIDINFSPGLVHQSCLLMKIATVSSIPIRESNKVKITGFMLF